MFEVAERMILAPSGLDEGRLSSVLGTVMSRGVDYADLYFQLSREESWSLEDGIVKDGAHSIEQGVGVRAISGEKTGFAYTDEVLLPALVEASDAARAIARSGGTQRRARLAAPADAPAVPADRSARGRPRRGQGGVADAHRPRDAPHRSARQAGDGVARRRARGRADRLERRHADRRRAAAGARQRLGDRRAQRPARAGLQRRRRALRAERAAAAATSRSRTAARRCARRSSTSRPWRRRPAR